MKRWFLLFTVLAASSCVPAGAVFAASDLPTIDSKFVLRLLGGQPGVPAEWAGVWETVDTTYNCAGVPTGNSASTDTLCTGQGYEPGTGPGNVQCSGSATATTYDVTCTGSEEVFPDCVANFTIRTHGTRTGDSYFSVTTFEVTYAGTAVGCDQLPTQCSQYNSHGTRIAPEPTAYCSTPALPTTWGKVKSIYR